jgi:hypothetical protein
MAPAVRAARAAILAAARAATRTAGRRRQATVGRRGATVLDPLEAMIVVPPVAGMHVPREVTTGARPVRAIPAPTGATTVVRRAEATRAPVGTTVAGRHARTTRARIGATTVVRPAEVTIDVPQTREVVGRSAETTVADLAMSVPGAETGGLPPADRSAVASAVLAMADPAVPRAVVMNGPVAVGRVAGAMSVRLASGRRVRPAMGVRSAVVTARPVTGSTATAAGATRVRTAAARSTGEAVPIAATEIGPVATAHPIADRTVGGRTAAVRATARAGVPLRGGGATRIVVVAPTAATHPTAVLDRRPIAVAARIAAATPTGVDVPTVAPPIAAAGLAASAATTVSNAS